jgi:hypothetical protein
MQEKDRLSSPLYSGVGRPGVKPDITAGSRAGEHELPDMALRPQACLAVGDG